VTMSNSPNQLSFLPDDYLERKARRRTNLVCAVIFSAFAVAASVMFVMNSRASSALDERRKKVEAEYGQAAMRIQQVQQMQEKQKRMARQAELTASLLEKVPRSYLLAEFTNSLPAGVSLLDFALTSTPRAPVVAAQTKFEQKQAARTAVVDQGPKVYDVKLQLTGVAFSDVQVAQYIRKLSESALLKQVSLVLVEEFKQDDQKLRKFQLEMRLDPQAEVQPGERKDTKTAALEVTE
jgi:Tfp pilus assembly protein PilN